MAKSNPKKFEPFTIEKATLNIGRVDFKDILKTKNPIIFDTNFLFIPFSFKIDIISEIQNLVGKTFTLYIYEGTIDELKAIEKKKDKNKHFLPLIVKMLHLYKFKIIKSDEKYIDKQILSNLNQDVLVATNDKKLRFELQKNLNKVMYLRQKSYLEIK